MEPNLDFHRQNTVYATHGLHSFAAKCPPQLVKYGLEQYSKPGDIVLDPMVGSGTTLVEAKLRERHSVGFDLDPLACLLSKVKTYELNDRDIAVAYTQITKKVERDIKELKSSLPSKAVRNRATPPEFQNRDYWFSPGVRNTLSLLSYYIRKEKMPKEVRDFFWVAFSSLILAKTSVANARDIIHSRHHFFVHEEVPDVLSRFDNRVRKMRKHMAEFKESCKNLANTQAEAHLGDVRNLTLADEAVDLIFTSPPYATALDYPRAHFLTVAWMMPEFELSLQEYRKRGASYIGSERGPVPSEFKLDDQISSSMKVKPTLEQIALYSERHASIVQRYFLDMQRALSEMRRVLKEGKYLIIVVCPSHIRKIEVPTHEILAELGSCIGFCLRAQHTRTISSRKRVLPYMRESFGRRMSTEFILVFQKD